ncbi:MAG: hypothetical protein JO108_00835 [Acidobacteriaceae bacterium]|nr:hypothetical protein [Acidobacteriaceae bacterium]
MKNRIAFKRSRFHAKQILCSSRRWIYSGVGLKSLLAAVVIALFLTQSHVLGQNLGGTPQFNQAVQGQQGTQVEGSFLNLINWIGNVIAPVGAGGAALMAIINFAAGRGAIKWVFTTLGLLSVSGITRLLEYWITNGTAGVS